MSHDKKIDEQATENRTTAGTHQQEGGEAGSGGEAPPGGPEEGADGRQRKGHLDLMRLRLSQDFARDVPTRKLLTTVPLRKPGRHEWVRTHPSPAYRFEIAMLHIKDEGDERYVVDGALMDSLGSEVVPVCLVPTMTRQGVLFVWPVRLPGADGRTNHWNESARDAADLARDRWIRLVANMQLGAYEVFESRAALPEPEWPDLPLEEILQKAFAGRVIDSHDHPVLRRLRGEL